MGSLALRFFPCLCAESHSEQKERISCFWDLEEREAKEVVSADPCGCAAESWAAMSIGSGRRIRLHGAPTQPERRRGESGP